jgi:preprotein translocase subunit SecD
MPLARVLATISLSVALLSGAVPAWAVSGFAPIEIRLVADKPGDGQALVVEGSDKTLAVEPGTLLGPSDFMSVGEVEWTDGKPGFNVGLTPAGAGKLERISADNVGRTLAIIVDGRILSAPKILDPVKAQGFLLTVDTEAEARDLAAKVRRVVAPN